MLSAPPSSGSLALGVLLIDGELGSRIIFMKINRSQNCTDVGFLCFLGTKLTYINEGSQVGTGGSDLSLYLLEKLR